MKKTITILSLLSMSFSGHCVSVFQCDSADSSTFSQFSCGENAQIVEFRDFEPINAEVEENINQETIDDALSVNLFQLEQRIKRYQGKIEGYRKRMDKQIDALKAKSDSGNHYRTALAYHQDIANEMSMVRNKYITLINNLKNKIKDTKQKQRELING